MICSSREELRREIRSTSALRWRQRPTDLRCVILSDLSGNDLEHWKEISHRSSVFLDPGYLAGLHCGLPSDDKLWYCLVYRAMKPVGIAVFHLTIFRTREELASEHCSIATIIRKSLTGNRPEAGVLICGNAFATGEHGFTFLPEVAAPEAMDTICYALTDIIRQEQQAGKKISAVVAKDFYPRNKAIVKALRKCGFRDFEVDPNMILPVASRWTSVTDYMADMNTKFRTKARAALQRSSSIVVETVSHEEFHRDIDSYYQLYTQVNTRAEYRLGTLTISSFDSIKQHLKDRMIIRSYRLDGKLVGFLTALDCGDRLDAHMVGIDYEFNKSHGIYSSMLIEYVSLAIALRKKWVMFGRTAGEMKSTVGAFPVQLSCCIRHPGKISNLLLNWLFTYVKPSEFPIREPWKRTVRDELQARIDEGPFCC